MSLFGFDETGHVSYNNDYIARQSLKGNDGRFGLLC